MSHETPARFGQLASQLGYMRLPVQVLQSAAGYYLGTINETGPVSRESQEYFSSHEAATKALATGARTQRDDV